MIHHLQICPILLIGTWCLTKIYRLYTFRTNCNLFKVDLYMNRMMQFVSSMGLSNISEIVSCSEFVLAQVENTIPLIETDLLEGRRSIPRGREVSNEVFQEVESLEQKLEDLTTTCCTVVDDKTMVGVETVERGLSND
ncbi:unnamed protein product [Leptidea sinapis]|uniref:Uncharacterized protein n=1 Tax=Leptidea sinapis TaxID=189913 RepID=A0A5E4QPB5_9NEOP|nr:unnamed protein product [Leptidea sinapis]